MSDNFFDSLKPKRSSYISLSLIFISDNNWRSYVFPISFPSSSALLPFPLLYTFFLFLYTFPSSLHLFLFLTPVCCLFLLFSENFFLKDHLARSKGVFAEVVLYVSVVCISEILSTVCHHPFIFKHFFRGLKKLFFAFLPFLTLFSFSSCPLPVSV